MATRNNSNSPKRSASSKFFGEGLTFDDVLLVPQYSDIRSRSEIDLSTLLDCKLPIISSPMDSVTEENVEKLLKDKGNKEVELDTVKKTTINKMWINELDELRVQYVEYKEERARLMSGEEKKKKTVSKPAVKKAVSKATVKKTNNLMIVEDE